jgi:UDP-sugar transporter A1/2/3
MVTLLRKSLQLNQWISLFILFVGVAIIQIQNLNSPNKNGESDKNAVFGLACVLTSCVLSGLASVYFEKILKNTSVSIWIRNIQLGIFSTIFATITAFTYDYESIQVKGFFFGYNHLVWASIFIQSFGGLAVAVVIKYADNILKGFATSIAIIVSCIFSVFIFQTQIDSIFLLGTLFVIASTILYSYTPQKLVQSLAESSKLESVIIMPLNQK